MTTLDDVKVGDEVFLNSYGHWCRVTITKINQKTITVLYPDLYPNQLIRRFHRETGVIVDKDVNEPKPFIVPLSAEMDEIYQTQVYEQKRGRLRLKIGRTDWFDFSLEQLQRIADFIDEVKK